MPAVQMSNNWQYCDYSYLDLFSIMVFRQIINTITLSFKRGQAAFWVDNDYCTIINSNCKLKLNQTKKISKVHTTANVDFSKYYRSCLLCNNQKNTGGKHLNFHYCTGPKTKQKLGTKIPNIQVLFCRPLPKDMCVRVQMRNDMESICIYDTISKR